MPRHARIAPGGLIYHVLNRAVAKLPLFRKEADYLAFERVLAEAQQRHPTRILAYCLMKTHWHFVVHPRQDGELTAFFRWLTHTHTMRWHVAHNTVGRGHLYQGRFKCFPVQGGTHLLTVLRYVERNPLSAKVVSHAQDWQHGSLWVRMHGTDEQQALLSRWPLPVPENWPARVNAAITPKEREAMKRSMDKGTPFGDVLWRDDLARRLGLQHTLRDPGRPPTAKDDTQ